MAPQKHDTQNLHTPLIPSEELQMQSSQESLSDQSILLSDQLDVIIVQPEGNPTASPRVDSGAVTSELKRNKSNSSDVIHKEGKNKGPEVPINCPHLETVLFFFGIAGMIVSVLMLLQHIIGNLISYY